jgi:two-component system, OmpR family, copper resistance phosphate regulon response regulator CusR
LLLFFLENFITLFMKILLVEDDPKISSFVKLGLEDNDFNVTQAYDSSMAEKIVFNKEFDIIILDVIIPGLNGLELCKKIRNANIKTPIIMLTSLDTVEDKVAGFECGADDYLGKPFSFKELHARIKALTRRHKEAMVAPILKIADLELDTVSKIVKRNNKEIKLTAREYSILELLISNKGKVFERFEIAEKVWGFSFNSGTNVIDVHINSLRNKIDKGFSQKLIHTLVGFGYVMKEGA